MDMKVTEMRSRVLLLLWFLSASGPGGVCGPHMGNTNTTSFWQSYLLVIKFSNPKISNKPMDLRLRLLSLAGGL